MPSATLPEERSAAASDGSASSRSTSRTSPTSSSSSLSSVSNAGEHELRQGSLKKDGKGGSRDPIDVEAIVVQRTTVNQQTHEEQEGVGEQGLPQSQLQLTPEKDSDNSQHQQQPLGRTPSKLRDLIRQLQEAHGLRSRPVDSPSKGDLTPKTDTTESRASVASKICRRRRVQPQPGSLGNTPHSAVRVPTTAALGRYVPQAWSESKRGQASTRLGPFIAPRSVFANPFKFRRLFRTPGPGSHTLPPAEAYAYPTAPSTTMAARFRPATSKEVVPGPGRYFADVSYVPTMALPPFGQALRGGGQECSSLFPQQSPGPGQYDVAPKEVGPTKLCPFSTSIRQLNTTGSCTSRDIWASTPGPGTYNPKVPPKIAHGISMSKAHARDLDNFIVRTDASDLGPGSYDPMPLPTGTRVVIPCSPNRFTPTAGIPAESTPGPGAYL